MVALLLPSVGEVAQRPSDAGGAIGVPSAGTGAGPAVRGDDDAAVIDTRLREAAERGEALELILVLRGKVRPAWGKDPGRWHLRMRGQPVFTFPAESVVAATPLSTRRK